MSRTSGEGHADAPRLAIVAADATLEARAAWLAAAIAAAWPDSNPPRIECLAAGFPDHAPDTQATAFSGWVALGDPEDRADPRSIDLAARLADAEAAGVPVIRLRQPGRTPRRLDLKSSPETIAAVLGALLETTANLRRSLRRERVARESVRRHDHELAEAAALQREFLPKRLPRHERFECSVLWRPAWHVSGDIYDVVQVDEHHIGVFLADAVGHGLPAAILAMGLARRLEVHDRERRPLAPSEVLRRLNAALVELRTDLVWFATAVYALYDLRTGEVRLASAGHPSAILLRRDGEAMAIEASGGLLGIFEEERYLEHAFTLDAGDRLVLHSDGIEPLFQTERDAEVASLGDGAEHYLARFAECAAGREAPELFADLVSRLERPDLAPIATDDVTVISLGYGPIAAPNAAAIEDGGFRMAA
ncbi:MAG: PP2C family protein-serine/threonine phosphatase [Phycisphaerales bacterium]